MNTLSSQFPIGGRVEFKNTNHLIPADTIEATITGYHHMGDGVHGNLVGQVWIESIDDRGVKRSHLATDLKPVR